jgi:hypothetical protein
MSCRSRFPDGEAHLLHEVELVGENPIGKRENVRGFGWWLFGGHHKTERKPKCTEREKWTTETENNSKEEQNPGAERYEHRPNKSK